MSDQPEKKKRQPRQAPTVVMGLPSLLLEAGRFDREEEARRVVVVEPLSVREDMASAMTGIPVETLRAHRKTQTGPPYSKDGASVIYIVDDLRAWLRSLPRFAAAS